MTAPVPVVTQLGSGAVWFTGWALCGEWVALLLFGPWPFQGQVVVLALDGLRGGLLMVRNIFTGSRLAVLALIGVLLAVRPAAAQQGWPLGAWGGGSGGGGGGYSGGGYSGGGFGGYSGYGYRPAPAYSRPADTYAPTYSPVAPVVTSRYPSFPAVTSRYAPTAADRRAHINVKVAASATIWFDGARTAQKGTRRYFVSPVLTPGRRYTYEVKARWQEGSRTVTRSRRATFRAGDEVTLTFLARAARRPR
jgi:uncharacterized protein (TIGR03000 family)